MEPGAEARRRAPLVAASYEELVGRRAAAEQAHEPDDGEHDDADPEKVDERAGGVEQQPEYEKDDRRDDERMNHFSWFTSILTVAGYLIDALSANSLVQ